MLVSNNSYLILGLSVNADDKLVNKRTKEMQNLLSIDEVPKYPSDISFVNYKRVRTTNFLKEAYHNLIDQNNRLIQLFYWFDLSDWKDWELFSLYQNWREEEALDWWLDEYKKMKDIHYLKNYLIASLLILENKDIWYWTSNMSSIKKNFIKYFDILYNDEWFWKSFKNRVNNQSTIKITREIIDDYKLKVLQELIDEIYSSWETDFYKKFVKIFKIPASNIEENKTINSEVENIKYCLNKINCFSLKTEVILIKGTLQEIINSFQVIWSLWMDNNINIMKLKDEVAEDILDIAIRLNNDYDNVDDAEDLMGVAKILASSTLLNERINKNTKTAEKNFKQLETNNFVKSIYISLETITNPISARDFIKILRELSNVNSMMKRIEDNGLLEKGKTNIIRNNIAHAVRACWVKFNNTFWDPERSKKLLEIAKKFSRSTDLQNELDQEIKTAEWNINNKKLHESWKHSTWCFPFLIGITIIAWWILAYLII